MPKRIQIAAYLSVDELRNRYRQATDIVEKSHYQVIWLLAKGKSTTDVSDVTSYSRDWGYKLVREYNELSPSA